jgi:hypothetical protein
LVTPEIDAGKLNVHVPLVVMVQVPVAVIWFAVPRIATLVTDPFPLPPDAALAVAPLLP